MSTESIIRLKKSSVSEKVPLAGDLEHGELAINFADGRLYFKNSVNEIEFFAAGTQFNAFGESKSFLFTATQGQDTFTGLDNFNENLLYNSLFVDVFVNGIRLNKQDYNTPNSQTIVLNTAVTVNDEVAVTTTEVTGSAVNGTNTRQVFTATEAQTVFVLTKDYDIGFIDVYQNGVKLVNDVDVDVSSGTEIVLTTGAASGDTIDVVSFAGVVTSTTIVDSYTKAESDNRFLPQADPAFTGTLSGGTIDATVTYDNAVSGLTATDVQAAIDEVTGDLANIDLAASNVTYNNSTSGLAATDVQAAIDEVTGDLGTMSTQDANNVTVSGGTVNLDANGLTVGTDQLVTSGGNVGIGTSSPTELLDVNGDAVIHGHTLGRGAGAILSNTAFGFNALLSNTTGSFNAATGISALRFNTTGMFNTANGVSSLQNNTTGLDNSAIGGNSLLSNTIGSQNSANGAFALSSNTTGDNNTGVGSFALGSSVSGSNNVALGANSGAAIETGSGNTIIGAGIPGSSNLTDTVIIGAGTTERLRIDSAGNVGIGTTSPQLARIHATTASTYTLNLQNDSANESGIIFSRNSNGGASSTAIVGNGETNGFLYAIVGGEERMRIDSSGNLLFASSVNDSAIGGVYLISDASHTHVRLVNQSSSSTLANLFCNRQNSNGQVIQFRRANTNVGSISVFASATAYNTSSDYRLKEDLQPVKDPIGRLKQLKPFNFAWKVDGTRVDGFLAHEAQEVVPEAITGTKDAMRTEEYEVSPAVLDEDGNVLEEAVMGEREVPDYQGIDQAKLVPLLTAALQDAVAKIESLEQRIQALEDGQA